MGHGGKQSPLGLLAKKRSQGTQSDDSDCPKTFQPLQIFGSNEVTGHNGLKKKKKKNSKELYIQNC